MAPGRRRGRDRDLNPRAAFLWFAGGGGLFLLLLKLATSHWFPPVALSLVLIVAYGFVLWDRELKGPKFEHAGDNLYYVGFLYTLISLAASLYQFTSDGYAREIVQGFGVALSSTVFGLIGRVYVNQSSVAEPAQVEAAARRSLVDAHRALRREMDYSIEDYKRFRDELRELWKSSEAANVAASEKLQALAGEAGRLDEIHGLGSRLEEAAAGALERIAERQDEALVQIRDEAVAMLRNIASQQETLGEGMAKAQQETFERAAVRLGDAAASMARTIRTAEQEIEAEAGPLRKAVGRSLESFRAADFEREVATRVLEPAETRLRELIDGFQPLVESLGSTQAGQERAVAENQRVLQQLSRTAAQNEDLAGRYQDAADSLARAASTLSSLPEQLERQSARSETVAREAAATGERLRQISGALEGASASLAAASRPTSRPNRGIFGFFRRT